MPEPLLLVPGLNCTGDLFAPLIDVLSPRIPVTVADVASDATIALMAGRALAAAPARFALAGLSMGGYVALEIMRLAPARVTRLALLDTSARPDSDAASQRRRDLIHLAEAGPAAVDEIHRQLWPRLVHPSRWADAQLDAMVLGMARATGAEAFARQQAAIMGRMDSRPFLSAIQVPTLVLVGEEDAITPPELAAEMADSIRSARLVRVPLCGHLPTLECPAEALVAVEGWLG
ncbi:MAG: alpha/beta fold hydrolase [Alsobacter sp.]|jgi:pimeloyl-ACP methyl ester carboxylesterase